jgi:hypothetical protein
VELALAGTLATAAARTARTAAREGPFTRRYGSPPQTPVELALAGTLATEPARRAALEAHALKRASHTPAEAARHASRAAQPWMLARAARIAAGTAALPGRTEDNMTALRATQTKLILSGPKRLRNDTWAIWSRKKLSTADCEELNLNRSQWVTKNFLLGHRQWRKAQSAQSSAGVAFMYG